MRRVFVTVIFATCFQLLTPTPADAFWRWIDEWSGPGPFNGVGHTWRLVCIPDKDGKEKDSLWDESFDTHSRVVGALLGSGCVQPLNVRTPKASLNFEAATLWSKGNHLQYASGEGPRVHLLQWEATMSFHVDTDLKRDAVEVGFGAGQMRVAGDGFKTFQRTFLEPLRLDVRPFAFAGGKAGSAGRAIGVRLALTIVPSGFDATDFGAIPGSYHASKDIVPSIGASVDLFKLFNR